MKCTKFPVIPSISGAMFPAEAPRSKELRLPVLSIRGLRALCAAGLTVMETSQVSPAELLRVIPEAAFPPITTGFV